MSVSPADWKANWSSEDPALLLVESLIHELIAAGTLDGERAIAVVEIAMGARDEIRVDRGDPTVAESGGLEAILATLLLDKS